MTLIPAEKLSAWNMRAIASDNLILENLLDFREFYDELKSEHGTLMQAYAEAAQANRMSRETFRDKFGLVKRYQDNDLREWFAMGLSFDHLDKAPSLAELSHRTPAQVLNFAASETMTVEQMVNWICEEQGKEKAAPMFHFELLTRKLWKLPYILKANEEQTKKFNELLGVFIKNVEAVFGGKND